MAEKLVSQIKDMKLLSEKEGKISINAGIGENPIDGANAGDIIRKARKYKDIARKVGENKVIGWE